MIISEVLNNTSAYDGCLWIHHGEPGDYDNLQWDESNTVAKPTLVELQTLWTDSVEAIVNLKTVRGERARAYPNIGDQLDMLYHAIDSDETLKTQFNDFYTAVKAVKDSNPMPE